MALDFNVSPFFDDHSEDKKFYRILFRPGYAVQARELTQLQTILQEQIKRHGDHVFKQGSMVIPGQIAYDTDVFYAKVTDYAGIDVYLNSILNKEVQNADGLTAEVIAFTLAENDDNPTLFLKYKNTVIDPSTGNNISSYTVNDTLSAVDTTILGSLTIPDIFNPVDKASTATIKKGVYYINDNFVLVEDQTIVLDKYSDAPSYKVGLTLIEDIIYPEEDESLLDNALGSPNYAAPGAARYFMNLQLSKVALSEPDTDNFIELLRLDSGKVIFKIDRSQYSELNKTLARRTYDESGDYTVSPFPVRARHYRSNFRGDWSDGEKYIQGDVIKTTIGESFSTYYFTCTIAGTSGTTKPTFATDPAIGYVQDSTVRWEYAVLPQFNKGVYTFNSGDTNYETFTLNDHIRLDGMLAYGIDAGKAYVRGYEIEKLSTEYVVSAKSRYLPAGSAALATYLNTPEYLLNESGGLDAVDSLSQIKTQNIDTSMGSYVLAKDVAFAPDINGLTQVGLFDDIIANHATAERIGTARVRGIEYHSIGVYKVFLFDIQMDAGGLIDNIKALGNLAGLNQTTFKCNMDLASGETLTINDPLNTSLIYPLADYAIQDIVSMDYNVVGSFTRTVGTGESSVVLTAESGYTFESGAVPSNYVIVDATGAYILDATFSAAGSDQITIGNLDEGIAYTIFATLKRSNASTPHATALTTDRTTVLTTAATVQVPEIVLPFSYVSRIVSVKMSSAGFGQPTSYDTDITNRYTFRANCTGSMIKKGSLVLENGAPVPTGPIQIKYENIEFTFGTFGDVINVESYLTPGSAIRYEEIMSVAGQSLRDSIDFRPVEGTSTYETRYFPKFGETTSVQYRNNLARVDVLSLSYDGNYLLSSGIASSLPTTPSTPQNAMKIATITLEPYTFEIDVDGDGAQIQRSENKRYSMRDIGKLERRIQDLEYYTSLSLLEMDTKNLKIVDSNGLERFQNGFIVDRFDGQGVGNSVSAEWNASIDSDNKELRPFFNQRQLELLEDADKVGKNYVVNGDLITFPFNEVTLIDQPRASTRENVNPYALYTFTGILGLTPWSDTWFATERRPDVIINDEGQYNAVVAKAEEEGVLGTVWNAWAKIGSSVLSLDERLKTLGRWSTANTTIMNDRNNGGSFWRNRRTFTTDEMAQIGLNPGEVGGGRANGAAGLRVLTIETSAVETVSARAGVRSFIVDQIDSRVLDDRILETKVVPFIRPRTVLVRGFGFRSNTRMHSFFDGANVDNYVECATRIQYTKLTGKHDTFITSRNCGSNVQNAERLVSNATGVYITGTVSVTNASTAVTGYTTSFLSEVQAGDTVFFGNETVGYMVASVTDNTSFTLKDAYTGTTASDIAMSVLSKKFSNDTVEMAFSHGEVVKEYTSTGTPTGRSFIVVGQEVNAGDEYYMWVLNEKGDKSYKTGTGYYLEGEYTDGTDAGTKPRIQFVARTEYDYLQSSTTGQVNGIFRIPNNPIDRFRTGTRSFKLSSSPTNSVVDETTRGTTIYEANGIVEVKQRTILSTRTAEVASEVVSDSQTIVNVSDRVVDDSGWFDPLAQTFLVQQEGGCFITSVDLFFATVDPTGKIPVRIEIREVINGYPGKFVLPFSRVEKSPTDIITDSLKGTVATNFKFQSPVYLQNGVEYALVAISDSDAYEIWISQTRQTDVVDPNTTISNQYAGVLFKSQNASTWTADQTQDMKFKIYRAEFTTSSAEVDFITPALKPKDLAFNPFNFVESGTQFRVEHRNHGFSNGDTVNFTTRQIVTFVNGIPAPYLFNTELPVSNVETDMYMVELSSVIPTAVNALTPATGSKTFTMDGTFDSDKFAAFRADQTVVRFTAYNSDLDIVYSDSYMQGTITSVSSTQIVLDVTSTGSDTSTEYSSWILSSTAAGKVGGAYISATENYEYQTVNMVASTNVLPDTNVSYTFTGITAANNTAEITSNIDIRENYDIGAEMVLPNAANYSGSNAAGVPMRVRALLTSTNRALSPALDLHGLAMTMVNNKIDNPNVLVNDPSLDYILVAADKTVSASTDFAIVDSGSNVAIRVALTDTATVTEMNKLKIGSVIKVDYAGSVTNSYQAIKDKYTDGTYAYYEVIPEFDPDANAYSAILANTDSSVDIYWMSHYVNDIAPFDGTTTSKYLTKRINFSRPADMVQIMFASLLPVGADIDVYIKTGSSASGDFDARAYTKIDPTSGYVKNDSEFYDMVYKVENLDAYDSIVVKIVMRSDNKAKAPRIKDLRVISCAA